MIFLPQPPKYIGVQTCTTRPRHNFLESETEMETKHVTQGRGWEAPPPHAAAKIHRGYVNAFAALPQMLFPPNNWNLRESQKARQKGEIVSANTDR